MSPTLGRRIPMLGMHRPEVTSQSIVPAKGFHLRTVWAVQFLLPSVVDGVIVARVARLSS